MRGACAVCTLTWLVGAWNLCDKARSVWDWVTVACALPVFAFLIGVYGYWAFVRSW